MNKIEDRIKRLMSEGNRQFVSLMFDHYGGALYGIVLRIVDEEVVAKKVMEQGFLKVWRTHTNFNSNKNNLFIWLFQIFKETAHDHLDKGNIDGNKNFSINELFNKKIIISQLNPEIPDTEEDHIAEDRFMSGIGFLNKLWKTIKVTIRKFMWFNVSKKVDKQLLLAPIHKSYVFNFTFISIILINLL